MFRPSWERPSKHRARECTLRSPLRCSRPARLIWCWYAPGSRRLLTPDAPQTSATIKRLKADYRRIDRVTSQRRRLVADEHGAITPPARMIFRLRLPTAGGHEWPHRSRRRFSMLVFGTQVRVSLPRGVTRHLCQLANKAMAEKLRRLSCDRRLNVSIAVLNVHVSPADRAMTILRRGSRDRWQA
jgi:hypothetical protein